jgi:hypothetical protein
MTMQNFDKGMAAFDKGMADFNKSMDQFGEGIGGKKDSKSRWKSYGENQKTIWILSQVVNPNPQSPIWKRFGVLLQNENPHPLRFGVISLYRKA